MSSIIQHINETDSTNAHLRLLTLQKQLPHGFTLWADHQSAGRGQQGNKWESAPEQNICMSTLLYPTHTRPEHQFILSQVVALSIITTLQRYASGFSIKWPNDIYWNNKKIGGILIENDLMADHIKQTIIGIGLNINQMHFTSDAPNPISLIHITHQSTDRSTLVQQIVNEIVALYASTKKSTTTLQSNYFNHLIRADGSYYPFRDANGSFQGTITHVSPDGTLTLQRPNGTTSQYHFKEVEHIL